MIQLVVMADKNNGVVLNNVPTLATKASIRVEGDAFFEGDVHLRGNFIREDEFGNIQDSILLAKIDQLEARLAALEARDL